MEGAGEGLMRATAWWEGGFTWGGFRSRLEMGGPHLWVCFCRQRVPPAWSGTVGFCHWSHRVMVLVKVDHGSEQQHL